MKRICLFAACFVIGSAHANAALVQYEAAGTVTSVRGASLTVGMPFTLSFEYNNSTIGVQNKAVTETDYQIPSNFTLHVAGVDAVGVATKSTLSLFNTSATIGGVSTPEGDLRISMQLQAYNLNGTPQAGPQPFILDFIKLGNWTTSELSPTGLSLLAPISLSTYSNTMSTGTLATKYFYDVSNEWHLNGALPGALVNFQLNSLSVVPEPSTIALLLSATACAGIWRYRRQIR